MTDIDQLKKKVKSRELALVIALGGSERALIDDALDHIRKAYLPTSSAELNHHKMTVGEHDLTELVPTLLSMPFLASQRLVELHGAEKLSPQDISTVVDYLAQPNSSSLLVMVFNKIDKKNKLVQALESLGQLFVFAMANDSDRIKFVVDEVKAHGMTIGSHAAQFLAITTNNDLLLIKSAIEKLSLLHLNQEISIDVIEENIVTRGEQDVFLLARFIGEGRLADALFALGQLRNSQENAIKFLGVLIWQFRILVHIRHCLDHRMSDWDIRKQVSVFGDRFMWMSQVAKKRTIQFHMERLTKLLDCDQALKSLNVAEPLLLVEKVVYQSAAGI